MSAAELILLPGLILLAAVEAVLAVALLRALLRRHGDRLEDKDCQPVAVILPLRGADPSLQACLEALLEQDYPDYQVHAVLDSKEDPAWPLVTSLAEGGSGGLFTVHVLDDIPATCSLKCAGVAQVLAGLDKAVAAAVLLDADVVPSRGWLREIAGRLRQSGADAVSGIRWFIPNGLSLSATVRYVWNAASVVQMYRHGIAWGGCLAITRKVFEDTDMLQRLRRSYGEDTVLAAVLRDHGLGLDFDPTLVMPSREDTTPAALTDWACRQLLSVRLHHSGWYRILVFGLLQFFLLAACMFLIIQGVWTGGWMQAGVAAVALSGYELLQVSLLLTGEVLIRRHIDEVSVTRAAISLRHILALLAAIIVAQVLHGLVLVMAQLCRTVTWRGVTYQLEGKGGVRLLSYAPYVQDDNDKNRSL